MKKGDKVKIYQDPYTEQKLEGEAIIKRIHNDNIREIRADVEFINKPGEAYYRTIKK